MTSPPRLPALLLRLLLPRDAWEAIAGDLEEEWRASPPGPGRTVALWRLALASIAAWWWGARQRATPRGSRVPRPDRPQRGDSPLRTFLHDLGHGVRLMLGTPTFTAAIVVTIGLGIGANAAIFSMVRGVILQPVPYADPERVAFLLGWDAERGERRFSMSMADVLDVARQARALDSVAAYSYLSANLTGGPTPERVQAYRVTGNTFDLLGVAPLAGRAIDRADAEPGANDVAVISYGLWDRLFARDPSVVGRQVLLNDVPHTVVGVMPRRFEFPVFNFKGDIWTPYRVDAAAIASNRAAADTVVAIARVNAGAGYRAAGAEVDTIMRRLAVDFSRTNRGKGARLVPMQQLDDEQAGMLIALPFVAVGVVLLLACANVANLLLARGVGRRRELAIRAALGAGRRRIVAQLVAESLLYAAAGGAMGIVLAWWALHALRASLPDLLVQTAPNVSELGVDWTTVLFTVGLSLGSGLLFGVLPALRTATPALVHSLRDDARAGSGRSHQRLRSVLVAAEVALSLMLLVAAGLLVRSFQALEHTQPGFNPRGVFTLAVTLPEHRYADGAAAQRFFENALRRIDALPGVERAAFVNVLPFSTYNRGTTIVADGQPPVEPGREPQTDYRVVTPGYFRTLEIPMVEGRGFSDGDREGTLLVAIVNRTLARRLFGKRDPIGSRVRLGGAASDEPWRTIVGIVGDVQHWQLTDRPAPEVYVPMAQAPGPMMMLAARVEGDPEAIAGPARAAIRAVDPGQPVFHVKTLARLVDDSKFPHTSAMSLMSLFGGLALLLAAVGLYSVIAYLVSQQTREFGVRMALGAQPGAVMRLVLWRGLRIVVIGGIIGVAGALAVTRLMAGMLVGITPDDPGTYIGGTALMALVSLVACAIPARRATRVDPVQALRAE